MLTTETLTEEQLLKLRGAPENTLEDEIAIANALKNPFEGERNRAKDYCVALINARAKAVR